MDGDKAHVVEDQVLGTHLLQNPRDVRLKLLISRV